MFVGYIKGELISICKIVLFKTSQIEMGQGGGNHFS